MTSIIFNVSDWRTDNQDRLNLLSIIEYQIIDSK